MAVGWCWPQSVLPGERVALHVDGARPERVEVVRDGLAPHTVWSGAGSSTEIPVGSFWQPGMYIVRLDGTAPTAWFIVRGTAAIVLELATNTWNAYNDSDGPNLYTGAVELSFARPLAPGMLAKNDATPRLVERGYGRSTRDQALSSWHGMAGWAGQERRFARWAEAHGITLGYATNADLEDHPDVLDRCRLVLSVGHDEYWTWGMRDTVEGFVARGGNAAFLSGNTCYWQVRIDGDVMVAYKHRYAEDPVQSERTTTMWSDPITRRPETTMTGVSFTRGGYHRIASSVPRGTGGYEVHRPDHWLLDHTGLRRGDQLGAAGPGGGGVVGYECDGCELTFGGGLPTGPDGFTVVATAPATPFDESTTPLPLAPGGRYELEFHAERLGLAPEVLRHGHAVLGCRAGTDGTGTVVTVGCTDWAYGLDDPIVDQVTRTILARLG
jgi:N,N-dimethylformamidase beta subunit-like, C-terminal